MDLPFTGEQFLQVFEQYNLSVWPAQILLATLGLIAIALAARPIPVSAKIISLILGFLWIWMGIVYHIWFFSSVNPAAYAFGALFVFQGIIFLIAGSVRAELSFRYRRGLGSATGTLLLGYALIVYPVLGILLGHTYPRAPTFGLPCPTTIFTFGLLLWSDGKFPRLILAIPAMWSLIGFSAALTLGILEDIGLLVAGVVSIALIAAREGPTRRLAGTTSRRP